MGQGETQIADDTRERLIETARTMVLRGDNKFSVATLCTEAGVDRAQFRAHFSGKTALMAAVMQEQVTHPVAVAAFPDVQPALEPQPPQNLQIPKAEQEPSVPTPDAWLERRLRVFERALISLEAKAEATAREHARVIAHLEERLASLGGTAAERRLDARPVEPVIVQPDAPAKAIVAETVEAQPQEDAAQESAGEKPEEKKPSAEVLAIAPLPVATLSKEEMADVLQSAREKARAAAQAAAKSQEQPKDKNRRMRWLAIGGLSLVVLFLCIGLTLGNTASATQSGRMVEWQGEGITHRHVAQGALAQTIASADFGDAKAEARLALAYLRGQGVARDAGAALRWSAVAAEAGQPVAQYLLGTIYSQGEAVKADPARAFAWFAVAANKGNLKAMHNLAIAYAQGQGTDKNPERAAAWFNRAAEQGYKDSQFDLAVLYERGDGVKQDAGRALKWYLVAARAGDPEAQTRATELEKAMTAADVAEAENQSAQFVPMAHDLLANNL